MSDNESRRLRIVDQGRIDAGTQGPPPGSAGAPSVVVVTATKASYPTSGGVFYWCLPQTVLGPETEGSAGTLAAGSDGFYVLALGGPPAAGTQGVATFVDHRWVGRFGQ